MERITVEMDKDLFEDFLDCYTQFHGEILKANSDYTIKSIEVKDDFFKEDARHKELKTASNKAYKQLKEYEYNQRNK